MIASVISGAKNANRKTFRTTLGFHLAAIANSSIDEFEHRKTVDAFACFPGPLHGLLRAFADRAIERLILCVRRGLSANDPKRTLSLVSI